MESYSRKQVARILGITDRTVWFYTEQGIVTPEVSNPKGKGTTRLYSWRNVLEISIARKLAGHGLRLERIRSVLNKLKGTVLTAPLFIATTFLKDDGIRIQLSKMPYFDFWWTFDSCVIVKVDEVKP